MQVKFEYEEPVIINDGCIYLHFPIATFETFEDLEEFLQNVELNDGYKLIVLRRETSNEINIYRHKD
jgi:hypothetical protein